MPVGLAGVLDDLQPVTGRHCLHRIHVGGLTVQVDSYDRLHPLCHRTSRGIDIDVVRLGVAADPDRGGAGEREANPAVPGELGLERFDVLAEYEVSPLHHLTDGVFDLSRDRRVLRSEVDGMLTRWPVRARCRGARRSP